MVPMKTLAKIVNRLLAPWDVELNRRSRNSYQRRYLQIVKELEGSYREYIFRDLPYQQNRVELLAQLLGTEVSEGLYILNYLHKSLAIEGDACEFGVAQGATSALLANEIRDTRKKLWLFDSFKGL